MRWTSQLRQLFARLQALNSFICGASGDSDFRQSKFAALRWLRQPPWRLSAFLCPTVLVRHISPPERQLLTALAELRALDCSRRKIFLKYAVSCLHVQGSLGGRKLLLRGPATFVAPILSAWGIASTRNLSLLQPCSELSLGRRRLEALLSLVVSGTRACAHPQICNAARDLGRFRCADFAIRSAGA